MKWCHRAKERVLYFKCSENKKQMLMHTTLNLHTATSCLGSPILVSGFHKMYPCGTQDENIVVRQSSSNWSRNMVERRSERYSSRKSTGQNIESRTDENWLSQKFQGILKEGRETGSTVTGERGTGASQRSGESRTAHMISRKKKVSGCDRYSARIEARRLILQKTGQTPTEIARKCFEMGQKFGKLKWTSQMDIAMKCSLTPIADTTWISITLSFLFYVFLFYFFYYNPTAQFFLRPPQGGLLSSETRRRNESRRYFTC